MTVEEVEHDLDEAIAKLPADIAEAIGDVDIFVAENRADIAVLRAAVTKSGQSQVQIPQDFRGVFLGVPLDADAADSEDAEPELVSGVFLFNAAMLRDAEDVVMTLFHEIGHALGLDEDEVAALGLA